MDDYFNAVWGARKKKWRKKIRGIDFNYIENILSKSFALSNLFGLAKSIGINFALQPKSFMCGKKGYIYMWEAKPTIRKIMVSVNPSTLQIVPVDLWEQRHVMAHEIGHVIFRTTNSAPSCFRDQNFKLRCTLQQYFEEFHGCLFHELGAEIEGRKIINKILGHPDVSGIIEKKRRKWVRILRKQHAICWEDIRTGRCPKKEKINQFLYSPLIK